MASDPIELAWAAGFFDGEGHMGMGSRKRRKGGWLYACAVMKVGQTEPTTLERFKRAVGCGTVQGPYHPPRNGISKRQRWEFAIHGKAALRTAELLMPYLSEPKRNQIRAVIAATTVVAEERPRLIEYRQAPSSLELLHRLYWQEGRSGEECAGMLGMSASGLRRWMGKADYPRRNPAEGRWATERRLAAERDV